MNRTTFFKLPKQNKKIEVVVSDRDYVSSHGNSPRYAQRGRWALKIIWKFDEPFTKNTEEIRWTPWDKRFTVTEAIRWAKREAKLETQKTVFQIAAINIIVQG